MAICSPSKNATRSRNEAISSPALCASASRVRSCRSISALQFSAAQRTAAVAKNPASPGPHAVWSAAVAETASAAACSASVASSNGVHVVCASPRVARRRGASFFSTAAVARERAVRHRSRRRLKFSAKSWSQRRRASSSGRSPTLERSTASFDAAATIPSQARHPSRRAAAKAASGASSGTASNAAAWAATPASTAASHSALTTAIQAELTTGVAPALNASTYVAASATKVLPRRAAPLTLFGRGLSLNSRRRKSAKAAAKAGRGGLFVSARRSDSAS
mmetsp:Transcript_15003/g.44164  ORF Transcript_15003/g.44164 Transcript_15003/m.44164 type:complete len:279 (+) Transcript_15003:624-1460(+)